MGQLNSKDAGNFPAPFLLSTHILTHNTVIHNGQESMFENGKAKNPSDSDVAALPFRVNESIINTICLNAIY